MGAEARDHAVEGSGHVDPLAFHFNFEGIASFGLAVVGQPGLFGEHLVPHHVPPLALEALQHDRQHFFGGAGIDLDASVFSGSKGIAVDQRPHQDSSGSALYSTTVPSSRTTRSGTSPPQLA